MDHHTITTSLGNCPTDTATVQQSLALFASSYDRSHFLKLLFFLLERFSVRYCVLHGWDELPDNLTSDLDLAVHSDDKEKLAAVFTRLRQAGFSLIDCRQYEVGAQSFYFAWLDNHTRHCIDVDVIFDYRGRGVIVLSGKDLMHGRRRRGSFWIPSAAAAFRYLLAKRVLKLQRSPDKHRPIRQLRTELGEKQSEIIAVSLLGRTTGRMILHTNHESDSGAVLRHARAIMIRRFATRHPLRFAGNLVAEWRRRLRRIIRPTGLLVAILGPDGAGKSSLIQELLKQEMSEFRTRRVFHWRPHFIGKRPDLGPVPDPHGSPSRPYLPSLLRLAGFFVDHLGGYCFLIRPLLVRSGLVIFDRYFHDIAVDSLRYRYGASVPFARALTRMIKQPDLMIILDAEVSSLLSRKSEVVEATLIALKERYLYLAHSQPHCVVINTNSTVHDSMRQLNRAICDCMNARSMTRHGSWCTGL